MTFHIRCLSILVLMACCTPTFFATSIDYIVNKQRHECKNSTNHMIFKIVVSEIILLVIVYLLLPEVFKVPQYVDWRWIFISAGLAPVNILLEMGEGYIAQAVRGKKPSRVSFNSKATDGGIFGIVAFAGIAITEEFIFRLIWMNLLLRVFLFGVIPTVILSTIVYALNHIYYGRNTVLQKLLSGTVYSLLFILSGGMILAPVVCHVTQNIIVVMLGEIRSGKSYEK